MLPVTRQVPGQPDYVQNVPICHCHEGPEDQPWAQQGQQGGRSQAGTQVGEIRPLPQQRPAAMTPILCGSDGWDTPPVEMPKVTPHEARERTVRTGCGEDWGHRSTFCDTRHPYYDIKS